MVSAVQGESSEYDLMDLAFTSSVSTIAVDYAAVYFPGLPFVASEFIFQMYANYPLCSQIQRFV